jgi:hypothetical protein
MCSQFPVIAIYLWPINKVDIEREVSPWISDSWSRMAPLLQTVRGALLGRHPSGDILRLGHPSALFRDQAERPYLLHHVTQQSIQRKDMVLLP